MQKNARKLYNGCVGVIIVIIVLLSCTVIYRYLIVTENRHLSPQINEESQSFNSLVGKMEFSCDDLEDLKIGEKLGTGNFRDTYVGLYRGTKVVVKVVKANIYSAKQYQI